MSTDVSVPPSMPNSSRMARINTFLDQYVLPYPVKYLTNRITILATLCLLVPLIALANVTVFVLAANSYLNVMSVVVSSTVLLYSTLSEQRDRAAAQRREEIAEAHMAAAERRAEADHELIQEIHTHLDEIRGQTMEHISLSLDNIQKMLVERMEKMQDEDHLHIEEMHKAVIASTEAHRQELASLSQLVNAMQNSLTGGRQNAPG